LKKGSGVTPDPFYLESPEWVIFFGFTLGGDEAMSPSYPGFLARRLMPMIPKSIMAALFYPNKTLIFNGTLTFI